MLVKLLSNREKLTCGQNEHTTRRGGRVSFEFIIRIALDRRIDINLGLKWEVVVFF